MGGPFSDGYVVIWMMRDYGMIKALKKVLYGITAGAVTGFIISIMVIPLNFYFHNLFAKEISDALKINYEYTITFALESALGTFLMLTLLGLIYGALYIKLPGKRPFAKALTLGAFLYFLTLTITFLIDFPISQGLFYTLNLVNIPINFLIFPFLLSKSYLFISR